MAVRLSIPVPEETWRKLRDMAEENRQAQYNGRPSIASVVQRIIEQRLAADKSEPARGTR